MKRFKDGLELLEPYRMGMSHHAEKSVVEFIADRRYIGLAHDSHTQSHEQRGDSASVNNGTHDVVDNRALVAVLIAVGGLGLIALVSNKIKLSPLVVTSSLALIAVVSLAVLFPVITRWRKRKP